MKTTEYTSYFFGVMPDYKDLLTVGSMILQSYDLQIETICQGNPTT